MCYRILTFNLLILTRAQFLVNRITVQLRLVELSLVPTANYGSSTVLLSTRPKRSTYSFDIFLVQALDPANPESLRASDY